METIGHHTCKKDGGEAHVLANAPFESTYDPKEKLYPYLGTGYYFWDDNLDLAKWWGKTHYDNDFFVMESKLSIDDGTFLDLVGNRQHQKHFVALMNKFRQKGYEDKKWPIAAFVEFMKKLRVKNNAVFPYNIIRAIDYNAAPDLDMQFNFTQGIKGSNSTSYTYLAPRMMVCIIEKNSLVLHPIIVYAS